MVSDIFREQSIMELEKRLQAATDLSSLREELYSEFLEHANYSTPDEWNRAVRLCECLAITGWGEHEGVEARCGRWVNGYPNTFFATPDNKARYLDAVWHQREGGVAIDKKNSTLRSMPEGEITPVVCENRKLLSQRNWLPKCPVQIVRTLDNCYKGSRQTITSIDNYLNPLLLKEMRPYLYGNQLNRILINCAMSFNDGAHCKTNYIIADEKLKLRKSEYYGELLKLYDTETIERDGLYLRPRHEIGPLRKETGMVYATIVFEKDFSDKTDKEQRELMSQYFLTTVERIAARQKRSVYNFRLMISDFEQVLNRWVSDAER